jgi:hypothetical protein
LTLKKVLVREGISSDTSATMEVFKGNNSIKRNEMSVSVKNLAIIGCGEWEENVFN